MFNIGLVMNRCISTKGSEILHFRKIFWWN